MLTRGSTTLLSDTMTHIDYFPLEVLDILPSPRVLATHMPVTQVPRDFFTRRCKMILCVRNPWDVALSFFHFVRNLQTFEYSGEWDGFFDLFLQGNGNSPLFFNLFVEFTALTTSSSVENIFRDKHQICVDCMTICQLFLVLYLLRNLIWNILQYLVWKHLLDSFSSSLTC